MRAAVLSILLVTACFHGDPVRFADLEDDAYIGGPQVTRLALDVNDNVEVAELYLDRQRVTATLTAPFELVWDAGAFPEGPHTLSVTVSLASGRQVQAAVDVRIDNTPPTLGLLPTTVFRHGQLDLRPADNGKLARLAISARGAADAPVVAEAEPWIVTVPWACGPTVLEVVATDAAGNELRTSLAVQSFDDDDADCDGYLAGAAGGDDCDDLDPSVHPGAAEAGDLVDHDCDGLAGSYQGVDADGDGVPSVASGGADCDDANAAVHGAFLSVIDHAVADARGPISWGVGDAAVVPSLAGWDLYLDRDGAIDRVRPGVAGGADQLERIATGANPRSIAAGADGYVAFGRGNTIEVWHRDGDAWVQRTTLTTDAPVGWLAYVPPYLGAEQLAYQAGRKVWFAERGDGAWQPQVVASSLDPLVEPPVLDAAPGFINLVFRTDRAAYQADRGAGPGPLQLHALETGTITAAVAYTNLATIIARDQPDATVLYRDGQAVATLPGHSAHLALRYPYLYAQLTGGDTIVLDVDQGYRVVQRAPALGAFDAASPPVFTRGGHVLAPGPRNIFEPFDPPGDGADRNCDGRD